jgi:hypothetical protein
MIGAKEMQVKGASMRVICMTALAIAAAFNPPFAPASESDPLNVLNNIAQETVECAAYFGVMSVALENSNKPDAAKKYNEFRDKALERAAVVTEQAGLKPETVGARFKMAVEDMIKRIDRNTSNASILMSDYNDLCIEVMTDVEKRSRYWIEQGSQRLENELKQHDSR